MIDQIRLITQQISASRFRTPGELVAHMGAMQAQDFLGAKWAVGLRVPGSTDRDIIQALNDRSIVRTWPMRGTLHFVASQDVRWMLALLTPRIIARAKGRHEQLDLDSRALAKGHELLAAMLQGGKQLTRQEIMSTLEAAGFATANQRGYHLLWHAAQTALICLGAPRGTQQTFTLLDEWVPQQKELQRDEALAELTRRYFTSHGPATLQDFVWWSGLLVSEARAGLEAAKTHLVSEDINGKTYWLPRHIPKITPRSSSVHLLPPFDEYLLGYTDRSAVLQAAHATHINPGANGMFKPIIVVDGQVIGTWKRTITKRGVTVAFSPFSPVAAAISLALEAAAERYATFLELPLAK
ncbi:MAG TPA: winged helix DNA-binding domain-containing protein [Candidatus Saccharimonadales bacterium]|nr:winged helix DNA-binding domain-containing protein [Candidatus Saccharimonadales bacterium]